MPFVRRRADTDDLPVSSFSDIAFLLIIFFILVTSLEQFAGFQASLPAGDQSAEQVDAEEMPTVKVHDSRITLNEETVSAEQLFQRLAAMNLAERASDEDRIVIIEASGRVPYQVYYEVMAAISGAGGVIAIVQEGD